MLRMSGDFAENEVRTAFCGWFFVVVAGEHMSKRSRNSRVKLTHRGRALRPQVDLRIGAPLKSAKTLAKALNFNQE